MITINLYFTVTRKITVCTKWIGFFSMAFTMFFVTFAVASRTLFHQPILGDKELVQLGMVVMIVFGLAYCQAENSHVSIGLIVDKFPERIQVIIDIVAFTLTFIVCLIVSYYYFFVALKDFNVLHSTTDMLDIPLYPFKFMVTLGFLLWGLESLVKVFDGILVLMGKKAYEKGEEHLVN
ncbi:TRAP transporter small permease [Neobacillus niacini]|uniref:TRAP transporter small permease subunit n=1 Tax=Neobacillus niacini TaxID=86668 RepID=UPI002FFD74B2